MEEAVVLYPSPGMGHLISMVEFGKFILAHHPSLSIIILTTNPPFNTGSTASYILNVSATNPSITFHSLPAVSLPLDPHSYPNIESITFELLRLYDPHVRTALQSISLSTKTLAFIIDLFCYPAFSIGVNLKIPTYHFFTSGAGCLACFLYFPTLDREVTGNFKDLNTIMHLPGLPPCPSEDLPSPMLDRDSLSYAGFLEVSSQMRVSAGLIVNTFESLEPEALEAIRDGLCVPDGPNTPPVFCVGPLIASGGDEGGDRHECLMWLDSQPSRSVVYLCFGSHGTFSAEQLKEMAVGLEKSGQRFLWVVRSPPSKDSGKHFLATPEPDLDALLPDGFLGRIAGTGRGMVVKSWAPQVAVLGHDSVGAFVTHCGWNSVLEALRGGVPMVGWPLYAEQRHNRVILVDGLKLALPMSESEDGFVTAAEVERRVREIMESEESKFIRKRAHAAREGAGAAMSEGGSSLAALAKLVEAWKSI